MKSLKIIAVILSISVTYAFATEPGEGQRYNTGMCSITNPDGTTSVGSWCNYPDPKGPCSRTSDCRLNGAS